MKESGAQEKLEMKVDVDVGHFLDETAVSCPAGR
jgi:hypothetical protein